MNIRALCRFIASHNFAAWLAHDGRIAVVAEYGDGTQRIELIEPNARAVRDWLGY